MLRYALPVVIISGMACGLSVVGIDPAGVNGDGGTLDGQVNASSSSSGSSSSGGPEAGLDAGFDAGPSCLRDDVCVPQLVTEGIGLSWYLAVDDSRVYVTRHVAFTGGDLVAAPKNGGPAVPFAAMSDSFDVAVDQSSVFVSSLAEHSLFAVPKDGGPSVRVWDAGDSYDIALRDGIPYFTSQSQNNHDIRAARPDGTVSDLRSMADKPSPEGIAVDGTHVYYALRKPGKIGRVNRDGSNADDNWHNAGHVRRLAVDDDAVYWTFEDNGAAGAVRTPKAGGSDLTLTDQVGYGTIVVDATHAYITLEQAGRVIRMNKRDGTGLVDVASGLKRPQGLADDGTSIFFNDADTGKVWRVTK